MKIPNINCKYYSPYGKCMARNETGKKVVKGQCVKIGKSVNCKWQLKYPRPVPPKAQG